MLQEPVGFATAVQGLLSCQRQAIAAGSNAGGEHLCFLGCGRLDEDQYTHMVVASFLQKHTQYVSLLTGGYQGNSTTSEVTLTPKFVDNATVYVQQKSTYCTQQTFSALKALMSCLDKVIFPFFERTCYRIMRIFFLSVC